MRNPVKAVTLNLEAEGKHRFEVTRLSIVLFVGYNRDGAYTKIYDLENFVYAFLHADPVLELADGYLLRVCQAGDRTCIRPEAQSIFDMSRQEAGIVASRQLVKDVLGLPW